MIDSFDESFELRVNSQLKNDENLVPVSELPITSTNECIEEDNLLDISNESDKFFAPTQHPIASPLTPSSGFRTAGKDLPVIVSETALNKARNLFVNADTKSNESVAETLTASTIAINKGEDQPLPSLPQEPPAPPFVGFRTAGKNETIQVSESALNRARTMMVESGGANSDDSTSSDALFPGFMTAGTKKVITVSEKSLAKAKTLMETADTTSKTEIDRISTPPAFSGFSTAGSNTLIKVNEKSLNVAKRLLEGDEELAPNEQQVSSERKYACIEDVKPQISKKYVPSIGGKSSSPFNSPKVYGKPKAFVCPLLGSPSGASPSATSCSSPKNPIMTPLSRKRKFHVPFKSPLVLGVSAIPASTPANPISDSVVREPVVKNPTPCLPTTIASSSSSNVIPNIEIKEDITVPKLLQRTPGPSGDCIRVEPNYIPLNELVAGNKRIYVRGKAFRKSYGITKTRSDESSFSFFLSDEHEHLINVVVSGQNCSKLFDFLSDIKMISIGNVVVREIRGNLNNMEILMDDASQMTVWDVEPYTVSPSEAFIEFPTLKSFKNKTINISGILTRIEAVSTVNRNCSLTNRREIEIKDDKDSRLLLVLWGAICVADWSMGVRVAVFRGIVRVNKESVFIHVDDNAYLESPYSPKEKEQSSTSIDNQISPQVLNQRDVIIDVKCYSAISYIADVSDNQKTATVRAFITDIRSRTYMYAGCVKCRKKVIENDNGDFICSKCNQSDYRQLYCFNARLSDFSGHHSCTFFDECGEKVLGETADECNKWLKYNPDKFYQKLNSVYYSRPFMLKIRIDKRNWNDSGERVQWQAEAILDDDYPAYCGFLRKKLDEM